MAMLTINIGRVVINVVVVVVVVTICHNFYFSNSANEADIN